MNITIKTGIPITPKNTTHIGNTIISIRKYISYLPNPAVLSTRRFAILIWLPQTGHLYVPCSSVLVKPHASQM